MRITAITPKRQRMQLVKEHPKGEQLFTAPPEKGSAECSTLGPSPWPVCIFWDPPQVDVQSKTTLGNDIRVEECTQHNKDVTSDRETTTVAMGESGTNVDEAQPQVLRRTELHHDLLIASGKIGGAKAPRILIDGGAATDLISSSLVEQLGLSTRPGPDGGLRVELIGGQIQDASACTPPTKMQLGAWSCEHEFHVTDLSAYDVILGKPWLTSHNPQIN